MKKIIASLIAGSLLIAAFSLTAEPTPTSTPSPKGTIPPGKLPHKPVLTATPHSLKTTPPPKPVPTMTHPVKLPKPLASATLSKPKPTATLGPIKLPKTSPTPTIAPIKIPGKTSPTPTATMGPIKIPGKTSPTPTPTVGPIKIPGKTSPTPTTTPTKILIPGKPSPTPSSTPTKILIPGKKITPTPTPWKKDKKHKDVHVWMNLNVVPPPAALLGPPVYEGHPPVRHSIPKSFVQQVDGGYVPVPETYVPPPAEAPVEESPTQLRAWNGQDDDATRAFDQTSVKVVAAEDKTMTWQFYWKTTGPAAQAARWEVATVPFTAGVTTFPPDGLAGYGDASVNAETPLSENFFAVDLNSFSANFEEGARPNKYYMRIVPVDAEGNVVGKASNFIRVDLP
jgi:hypothetical protein